MKNKTISFEDCAHIVKAMPIDEAIQQIKADITGQPSTQVIDVDLVVSLIEKNGSNSDKKI